MGSGSGKMFSINIWLVIQSRGFVMVSLTALVQLPVIPSYPGAVPVGSKKKMKKRPMLLIGMLTRTKGSDWIGLQKLPNWLAVVHHTTNTTNIDINL